MTDLDFEGEELALLNYVNISAFFPILCLLQVDEAVCYSIIEQNMGS